MTAQQTFRNTLVVLATLLGAYIAFRSLNILIVLLMAVIIASAARPAVMSLSRRVPLTLSVLLVYLLLFLFIVVIAIAVLPSLTMQLSDYISNDGRLANRLLEAQTWLHDTIKSATGADVTLVNPDALRASVTTTIKHAIDSLPAVAGEFGSLLGNAILVVVIGIYWLTARDQAVDYLLQLFRIGRRSEVQGIVVEIESSMGYYVRGVFLVACFVGIANFIILAIFQVPNAVTLAFIMGITTILPVIGGYLGAGAATLLALLSSPVYALIALGSFIAVQQVETHFLTPRVMSRSVGLNPILIIVFLFVGFELDGVIGGLIAVPIAGTIAILVRHLVLEPRKAESTPTLVQGGILVEGSKPPEPVDPGDQILISSTR